MCDWRTINEDDLVPIPVYFPPKDSGLRFSTLTEGDRFEVSCFPIRTVPRETTKPDVNDQTLTFRSTDILLELQS